MSFKDWSDSLKAKLRGNKQAGQMDDHLSNGSTSGYHPGAKRDMFATSSMPSQKGAQQTGRMTQQQEAVPGAGMADGYAQDAQMGGWQQPVQEQPVSWQTGWQQPVQQNWQDPQQNWQDPQQNWQQPQQNWQQPQQNWQQPQQNWQDAWQSPQNWQQPQQPVQQEQPAAPDNITYISGRFTDTDGRAYAHVERVVQLVSTSACYRVIEFMRNEESVVVSMENIGSDAEAQRCIDMLSGAAFTLECKITKITQNKRAYLISPAVVMVMQDKRTPTWGKTDNVQPEASVNGYGAEQPAYQGYDNPQGYAPQQSYAPQQGYTAQMNYAPQQGYTAQMNYAPQQGYTAQMNYAPQQGYTAQMNYAPQQGYTAQMNYAPQQEQPAQQNAASFGWNVQEQQASNVREGIFTQREGAAPRASYDSDTRRGYYGTVPVEFAR